MVQEVVGGYRPPGDLQPPSFPLLRGLGWLFGGEQVVPTQWTAPVLPGEQAQRVGVQRGGDLAPPCGPVPGQGGVVWGRPALDHGVPDDGSPGEPGQVGAAVTVTEHPFFFTDPAALAIFPLSLPDALP